MLEQILQNQNLIFYVLGAELLLLCLLQLRTNGLLKRTLKLRAQKKETIKQLKNEVKNGASDIPVVKFEKERSKGTSEKAKPAAGKEKKNDYDAKEMAVLQEMMAEFFG